MAATIPIGRDLELPANAATQVLGLIGRRGSGKTYGAGKLVEGLLEASAQVVIFDSVGSWWGLRLAADGKKPGFEVPVFGGRHGDIPLEPGAGAFVADVVIERGISVVLDLSGFRKAQRQRFVTEFAEELFHRKKSKPSPVHLVFEEAQLLAPQQSRGDTARMLGAIEDLVRLGRNYGIGCTLISQRPQSVNKEVLNQVEALFVFQLTGPQERKAIQAWVVDQAIDVSEMVDELPALPRGSCFVWSPQWLRILDRYKIGKKRTYDASATPELGAKRVEPRTLEAQDLEQLQVAMAKVVQEAERNDPKALRAQVGKLERELNVARRGAAAEREAAPAPEALAQARAQGAREGAMELLARLIERDHQLGRVLEDLVEWARRIVEGAEKAQGLLRAPQDVEIPPAPAEPLRLGPQPRTGAGTMPAASRRSERGGASPVAAGGSSVPGVRGRILAALAELEQIGVSAPPRAQVAIFSGYQSAKSTGFAKALSSLSSAGLVRYPGGGTVELTDAGRAEVQFAPGPMSEAELHERIRNLFPGVHWRILEPLIAAGGGALSRDQVAQAAGYENVKSTGFAKALSRLSSMGLVEYPEPGAVRAADLMFL